MLCVIWSSKPSQACSNSAGAFLDSQLRSDVDRFAAHPDFTLVALFGPEHGVRGDVQAGDHVASARDAATGLPVHSLYGEHREPTPAMLDGIDVLVFDIQDVGTRFYTYPYTLAGVMRAAKRAGIPVVVQVANAVNKTKAMRSVMESVAGVDKDAWLPELATKKFRSGTPQATSSNVVDGEKTPGKVAIFSTCYVNYNEPGIGHDLLKVLEHNQAQMPEQAQVLETEFQM